MAFYLALEDCTGQQVAELWLGHRDRSYIMADGGYCPVFQQVAWCWECRTFVAAEQLRDLSEIDADEAQARKEHGWFQDTLRGPNDVQPWLIKNTEFLFAEQLAGYARQRAWRRSRQSPPRCLECGSTRIEPMPRDLTNIRHPLTGMTLKLKNVCHASMAIHLLYTPEGERHVSREAPGT